MTSEGTLITVTGKLVTKILVIVARDGSQSIMSVYDTYFFKYSFTLNGNKTVL